LFKYFQKGDQFALVFYQILNRFIENFKKQAFTAQQWNFNPKISTVKWCIHRLEISFGTSINILLGTKKVKIGLQSPKPEFWQQNQHAPIDWEFYMEQEKL
jgi:hypothetical protein